MLTHAPVTTMLPVVDLALNHAQLDLISVFDGDVAFAVGQRGDRSARLERGVQLVAVVIDLALVHVVFSVLCSIGSSLPGARRTEHQAPSAMRVSGIST